MQISLHLHRMVEGVLTKVRVLWQGIAKCPRRCRCQLVLRVAVEIGATYHFPSSLFKRLPKELNMVGFCEDGN